VSAEGVVTLIGFVLVYGYLAYTLRGDNDGS